MMDSHYQDLQHQSIMNRLIQEQEYSLFAQLKPSLTKDGNMWCVLYGDNLQTGIVGFGETPYLAVLDFTKQWYKN